MTDGLLEKLRADPDLAALLAKLEAKVAARKLSPGAAARQVLSSFFKGLQE